MNKAEDNPGTQAATEIAKGDQSPSSLNLGDGAGDRVASLERQLHTEKVEAGRVKALAAEIKALKDENAKLRDEIANVKAANHDYVQDLPEEMRESVDPAQINAFGRMMDDRLRRRDEDDRRRRDEENRRDNAREEQKFLSEIDSQFPGFLRDTDEGGANCAAWLKFLEVYRGPVQNAYASRNIAALGGLIKLFYSEAGIQYRGASTTVTPRPTAVGSSDYANPAEKHVYTRQEYESMLEKAGKDVRSGAMTGADYAKIRAELTRALNEGRVMRQ